MSHPSERTPLLRNGNGSPAAPETSATFAQRVVKILKAEGEPGWIQSYKYFFSAKINVLLILVPLSVAAHYLHWDAALRFGFSFFAIVPLAKVCCAAFTLASPA